MPFNGKILCDSSANVGFVTKIKRFFSFDARTSITVRVLRFCEYVKSRRLCLMEAIPNFPGAVGDVTTEDHDT